MPNKQDKYLGANITLDSHYSSFQILEITKQCAKLKSTLGDLELIIHFDPDDELDKSEPCLREQLEDIYQWHMKYCEDCMSGKEKPSVGYHLELSALLAELTDKPLPKEDKRLEFTYDPNNVAGDWFWELPGTPVSTPPYEMSKKEKEALEKTEAGIAVKMHKIKKKLRR